MIAPCAKCGGSRVAIQVGKRLKHRCRPCEAEYQRENYAQNAEKIRARKAEWMANARKHPERSEKIRETQRRSYANRGRESQKERLARMKIEQPFRWRCRVLFRENPEITPDLLERLWNEQGGLCGLTGRPITIEEADIDHVLPRSRGGKTAPENLRWVWRRANESKGNMTDDEFLTMCSQVAEWIGRRIMEAAR